MGLRGVRGGVAKPLRPGVCCQPDHSPEIHRKSVWLAILIPAPSGVSPDPPIPSFPVVGIPLLVGFPSPALTHPSITVSVVSPGRRHLFAGVAWEATHPPAVAWEATLFRSVSLRRRHLSAWCRLGGDTLPLLSLRRRHLRTCVAWEATLFCAVGILDG